MIENAFFSMKPAYKEFLILNGISNNINITQRELAENCNMSVALVNKYISDLFKKEVIEIVSISSKQKKYTITSYGVKYKLYLNVQLLHLSQKMYDSSKKYVLDVIKKFNDDKIEVIALYGAGEVADIILPVLLNDAMGITVKCIFDDDIEKNGTSIHEIPVIRFDRKHLNELDAILISSFTYSNKIYDQLSRKLNNVYKLYW